MTQSTVNQQCQSAEGVPILLVMTDIMEDLVLVAGLRS